MGLAKHSTCGLSRRARVVVEPSDQRTYAQTESRQTESRQNKTGHRLRCLHSKDISMALPKLRGVQGELAETLVAELSTLQPHPASVGRLLRLHPVETVEAVGVRACRGRAVPPVAERVQNGSAGGVIDPTPSVLCTCAGKQSRLGQTSAAGSPVALFCASSCSRVP